MPDLRNPTLIFFFSVSLLPNALPQCQTGYSVVSNISSTVITSTSAATCVSSVLGNNTYGFSYCQCLELCNRRGHRILMPDTYAVIRASLQVRVHIGVNDFIWERGNNKSGWQVVPNSPDSLFLIIYQHLWLSFEPNGSPTDDCVNYSAESMGLVDGCYIAACVCEHPIDNQHPVPLHQNLFSTAPVSTFSQEAPTCTKLIENSPVQLHCSAECRLELGCVGFYHNEVRRECVLMHFLDAAVQLNYASVEEQLAWKKKTIDLSRIARSISTVLGEM